MRSVSSKATVFRRLMKYRNLAKVSVTLSAGCWSWSLVMFATKTFSAESLARIASPTPTVR